ncbi:fatty acyl-CoA reductase wat-like [Schistocerca americana]|uniref:fatty acyl-CoA reductase wat-like n=1 Tax=Schistocerca americana TaxID=7009 RepID=UPI001F500709|nr:fatty acyl-CoA reductase wat-like [Schistocerca americana]
MPCCELHPRVMTPEDEQRELEALPADWWPPGVLERLSRVAAFYDGAAVFLTGATGFVGTLVLEKLLRSCPGVSTVYVLVRHNKGVPLRERLRSHLDKVVFSKAREACPDYLRKVVAVAGDCTQPGLGISPADAAELTGRVSVVFHVAATVRFDADLWTATVTNVGSTCEVIALAKRMPNLNEQCCVHTVRSEARTSYCVVIAGHNYYRRLDEVVTSRLQAFVYMSTAYSHAPRDEIDEKFYPPALKAEELLKLISVMDDEQLAQLLPLLMGDWPNTYTFTKAIAEDLIHSEAVGLPASIIRPSIVSSTYQEPLALWVGNMYGPTAAGAGSSVGLLHAMHMDRSALVDGVPADMVANATLGCAWDTWCRHSSQTPTQRATAEPVIYNYVSTPRHPISWDLLCRYVQKGTDYPSIRNLWVAYVVLLKEKYLYVIAAVVLHLIPAMIVDSFLYLKGMKPILWNMYSKIHMVSQALEPFWTKEWTFKDDNVVSLLVRLGEADRKLFPFDIADYDWECHLANTMRGFRLYIMNESFDNLEAARKRYHRLLVLHYTLLAIASAVLLLVLWRILAAHIGL